MVMRAEENYDNDSWYNEMMMVVDNIDDYLEGKKIADEVRGKIEAHYLRSEHKRRLPVTVFDFYNI